MLDDVLDVIKEEVDGFLKLKMRDSQEQYVKLVPVVDLEGKPSVTENTVCMTLVKIENDGINMSNGAVPEMVGNKVYTFAPPIKLRLFILFSAAFSDGQEKNYKEALKRLSHVISFFQAKPVFTPQNTPALEPDKGEIQVELYNEAIEEQSYLWGMMGSLYRPSALYRLRTLWVQEHQVLDVHEPTGEPDFQLDKK